MKYNHLPDCDPEPLLGRTGGTDIKGADHPANFDRLVFICYGCTDQGFFYRPFPAGVVPGRKIPRSRRDNLVMGDPPFFNPYPVPYRAAHGAGQANPLGFPGHFKRSKNRFSGQLFRASLSIKTPIFFCLQSPGNNPVHGRNPFRSCP